MKTECACDGEWLRKYNELERRLESVRGILNMYPTYMPPFNRAAQPFERIEILLSDIQELHDLWIRLKPVKGLVTTLTAVLKND